MDKAQTVFEKYSGLGTTLRSLGRKFLTSVKELSRGSSKAGASSGNYVKTKMPDYIGKSKSELIKSRYPAGPTQIHMEKEFTSRSNTRGKLPVAPPNREKLLRDLEADRFKRSMGI